MSDLSPMVISNVIVAGLLGSIAWLVGRSGRRAAIAHSLWVVFFIKLVTPPIVMIPITVPQEWIRSLDFWRTLGFIWLFGFVFLFIRGLIRFFRFHRLLRREGVHDLDAASFVRSLLSKDSIVSPQVLRLPIRVSPMLFGFGLRPVIVCPDQLWHSLSENERRVFLAHETAHYVRRDHWVRWLEWIVTAAYWWFPGVYIARNQLERHEEACCDAWAIRKLGSTPRQYADALLRVVDFVCDHRIGIPRLASAMQPTESLAERLRLLMKQRGIDDSPPKMKWAAGVFGCSVLLAHPVLHPTVLPATARVEVDQTLNEQPHSVIDSSQLADQTNSAQDQVDLATIPTGFWNQSPDAEWASFSLALPGARLVADVKTGISIEAPPREPLQFLPNELSAIVEIPATQRVVIGDSLGQLRLWDLTAGVPVSLIAKHSSAVTSIAFHNTAGLVSADHAGTVMRWDLQSGQVLGSWPGENNPVQSVRYSTDGQELAVLQGSWTQLNRVQQITFLDATSLAPLRVAYVSPNTAVVVDIADHVWVAVEWSGTIRSLHTYMVIATVPKHRVSALVLSQQTSLVEQNTLTPPVHSATVPGLPSP